MEDFKSWEEMTTLEQYACQFWDMYKDAYGVRPRGIDTSAWSESDFEAEFASLGKVIDREEAQRRADEAKAVVDFEARVAMLVNANTTREQVVAWMMDAEGANGDYDYFCFCVGLPYGYFRSAA